ncbi:hypothetical protein LKR43_07700 [Pusillimonas sp. MFBS29]|uniref:hypothetical protein n=1 Tax=Pusillimonas sp. MFBS29 TaxID=2886690 RepID=UPI001D124881|nr:hypothetical protein [Pusillimonas sp. MFBS29]MCC2596221.1 hypothetical protein [Pusillimonas sp. MFBS29]
MSKQLTTSTRRGMKPVVSQDAKDIADGISRQVSAAVNQQVQQTLENNASLRDAKLRRVVEKSYGAEVADGLAGEALAALARQCEQDNAGMAANARNQSTPQFDEAID